MRRETGRVAHRPQGRRRARAREHAAVVRPALEEGVDLIEFDVLALADGTLVLAHSDDLAEVSHGLRAAAYAALARRAAPRSLPSCRRSTTPALPRRPAKWRCTST